MKKQYIQRGLVFAVLTAAGAAAAASDIGAWADTTDDFTKIALPIAIIMGGLTLIFLVISISFFILAGRSEHKKQG